MHINYPLKMLALWSLFGCLTTGVIAQETAKKLPVLSGKLDNLVQGRLYSPNYFPIKGSPFLTKDWSLEDIRVQGKDYQAMPIWYDIYLDDLILLNQSGSNLFFIRLNKEQVEHFSIGSRQFVNLAYSDFRDLKLEPGYYEKALSDKVLFLIKRSLELQEQDRTLTAHFSRNDRRFLIIDGIIHHVRNRKTLLKAAGKRHKPDLSGFIKSQKIQLNNATRAEWIAVVRHLNTLQPDRS